MADDAPTRIAYQLALTRVDISGTATTERAGSGGRRLVASTVTVATHTGADPNDWLTLALPDQAVTDRSLTLTLSDDGRLLSTDATATGRAGSVIRTAVSTVATVVGTALGLAGGVGVRGAGLGGPGLLDESPGEAGTERDAWAEAHPHLVAERETLQSAASGLAAALTEAYGAVASADTPASRRDAIARIADLRRTLDDVSAALADLHRHRHAWTTAQAGRRREEHSFTLKVSELPDDRAVIAGNRLRSAKLDDPMASVATALGVVVTRRDLTVPSGSHAPDVDGSAYEAIWYRVPRQVELRVYRIAGVGGDAVAQEAGPDGRAGAHSASESTEADTPAGNGDPAGVGGLLAERARSAAELSRRLAKGARRASGGDVEVELADVREVLVADDRCAYGSLALESPFFGTRSSAVTFGPHGAPTSVGSSSVSALAEVAETAGKLPAEILGGLELSGKLTGQLDALAASGDERRLGELERRRKLVEAELALEGASSTAGLRAELARLEAVESLLTGRKGVEAALADLELAGVTRTTRHDAEVQKIANALAEQDVARLKLEAQVHELRAKLAERDS